MSAGQLSPLLPVQFSAMSQSPAKARQTVVSGAVFAGLISTEALVPHALDKWLGINGNWFLLFGGVILIFTLIQHPEGVAGAFYKRMHRGKPGPTREERVFSRRRTSTAAAEP